MRLAEEQQFAALAHQIFKRRDFFFLLLFGPGSRLLLPDQVDLHQQHRWSRSSARTSRRSSPVSFIGVASFADLANFGPTAFILRPREHVQAKQEHDNADYLEKG